MTIARPSREGGTDLWLPDSGQERGPGRRRPVFYNRAMAVDRDVGVAVARALRGSVLAGGARGWEMLAATGVRGLRTLHESDLFGSLELTESGSAAFEVLSGNVARSRAAGARARAWDARRPLERNGFDFVDLDPYGSPGPFLPAAIEALRPPGVLAVTATDLRV
ncbi:MAG TPA: tRNA (guanine-N2)-dimethyltransferase, partial [Thermoplasmata archaeon]|nr:tRNA (guanine-N2)-dimethyltransferase [Thermoplasmata archaeon]